MRVAVIAAIELPSDQRAVFMQAIKSVRFSGGDIQEQQTHKIKEEKECVVKMYFRFK